MDTFGDARLYLGDCLEVMSQLEAQGVDLICADLPYGVTACTWDRIIPFDRLWSEYERVLKPNGSVVLTASQPFTTKLINSKVEWFRYELIWKKNTVTGFLNSKYQPLRNHENVIVFSAANSHHMTYHPQGLVPVNKIRKNPHSRIYNKQALGMRTVHYMNYPRSVLEFPSDLSRKHPTQKPVGLMAYLILTFSNPGDLVLDNTMGAGTTGVAALPLGRRFIGIELEQEFYDMAKDRIQLTPQGRGQCTGT